MQYDSSNWILTDIEHEANLRNIILELAYRDLSWRVMSMSSLNVLVSITPKYNT